MSSNLEIVRAFIEAWSRLDAEELAGFFAEDGIYHNILAQPVKGKDAICTFIAQFSASWTKTDWEIVTLVEHGDIVVGERVDRTRIGEVSIDLPCCGVFEMVDGKIAVWRDYFDMGTYMKAFAAS
jgi:limonene-1,2-epoxide hydrolase